MIFTMRSAALIAAGLAVASLAPMSGADAKGFNVLYRFCAQANCSDGRWPYAGLVADTTGNLYGTTGAGGATCRLYGCGTVFKLAPDGTETVLHQFTAQYDGSGPYGGVILDKKGNLYGTTASGGSTGCGGIDYGCGTVFKINANGKEKVLYAFGGNNDGAYPLARLVERQGNLYGTTSDGGGGTQCIVQFGGCGTVFEVTPAGIESKLYSFSGGSDGANPQAALIADKSGNLFGTTAAGGNTTACNQGISPGCGVVFELTAAGAEKTLYAFQGGNNDGWSPVADLVEDENGNLYGTTEAGGSITACNGVGCGIVFEIAPDGTETILHDFTGGNDGAHPVAGLIVDGKGNLYGTTSSAGAGGYGTVFKLEPGGRFKVLNSFTDGNNGYSPVADLLLVQGELYGTDEFGDGTVFELAK